MSSLDKEWERCKGYILDALAYANHSHSLDDVKQSVEAGTAQFMPLDKSAIVTEIVDYPKKSVCRIWLAGGDMDELIQAEKHIARWAKSIGCHGLEIIGRKGWQRVLTDYTPQSVVLTKEL
jgi:hypothetical protein